MKKTILYSIVLLLTASSCALNKLFLHPAPLVENDSYSKYVEKYNDTLTLSFNEDRSPLVTDSKKEVVDLPYTVISQFFKNRKGDQIHTWLVQPKGEYNGITIYYLHGNAGNLAYQYGLMTPFVEAGYQVFMIDYSGFGFSEGKAKRRNVFIDANDGLNFLLSNEAIKYEKLIVYGQSLGGHLAAVVGPRNQSKIDALVIEGAFSSHSDIANDQVPLLGRIFTREIYSGKKTIPHMKKPVLIIHSTEDQTVPYHHGVALFEAASEPKSFYSIEEAHIRGPLFYGDSIMEKMEKMIE